MKTKTYQYQITTYNLFDGADVIKTGTTKASSYIAAMENVLLKQIDDPNEIIEVKIRKMPTEVL